MSQPKDERSLGELVGELARESSTLIRQEVQLAKTELAQKAAIIGKNAGMLIGAAVFALVGFQALIAAAILALSQVMSSALAALIVGGVLLVIGAILAGIGLSALKKANLAPQQTVETIKEDVQWAKQQIK